MKDLSHRHHGHRKRAIEGLMSSKDTSITDIQLLEFILFYCIERVDTNPISHRLLDTFGSMENVFAADESQIAQVRGMGPISARKLKRISEFLSSYHTLNEQSGESDKWTTSTLHHMVLEAMHMDILPKHPNARYTLLFFGATRTRSGSYPIITDDCSAWLYRHFSFRKRNPGEQIVLCVSLKGDESDIPKEIKEIGFPTLESYGITAVAIFFANGELKIYSTKGSA